MNLEPFFNQTPASHADLVEAWESQILNSPAGSALCGKLDSEKERFLVWFRAMPLERQEQIIQGSLAVATGDLPGELDFEQELMFLKKFLFRYKMMPLSDDIFNHIGPDDFIEVYNPQGVQIYRSWNFFKFCRYTIDEVLSKHWIELYERPEFVEKQILSLLPHFYSKESALVPFNIKEHVVKERLLNPSYKYLTNLKFACPLQDVHTKEIVAAMSVANAKQLDH